MVSVVSVSSRAKEVLTYTLLNLQNNSIKKGQDFMNTIGKGKYFFGSVKVGQKGQIVIPAEARKTFNIKPGDSILVIGDEKKGIALVKADIMKTIAFKILEGVNNVYKGEEEEEENIEDEKE